MTDCQLFPKGLCYCNKTGEISWGKGMRGNPDCPFDWQELNYLRISCWLPGSALAGSWNWELEPEHKPGALIRVPLLGKLNTCPILIPPERK